MDDIFSNWYSGHYMSYKDASAGHGPVRVTKSSDENLRDRGTYIICFKDHVTEEELQQFLLLCQKALLRIKTLQLK